MGLRIFVRWGEGGRRERDRSCVGILCAVCVAWVEGLGVRWISVIAIWGGIVKSRSLDGMGMGKGGIVTMDGVVSSMMGYGDDEEAE